MTGLGARNWRPALGLPTIALMMLAVITGLGISGATPARAATLTVAIDLSDQQMRVSVDGWRKYRWPVSTARRGYRTPTGSFRPVRLERQWYSRKYHWSPMPHSVFFYRGYAIHGTTEVKNLGRPASHGCVRLHPDNARRLFELIRQYGRAATRIVITR